VAVGLRETFVELLATEVSRTVIPNNNNQATSWDIHRAACSMRRRYE